MGLATESPELLKALQRFANGERQEADTEIARIHAEMDSSSQRVADLQKAARRRQRAAVTRSMVQFGERTAVDERTLLEEALQLDPTFSPGWVRLSELYGTTGCSSRAITAAREAIARSATDSEKFYSLRAFAVAISAEGDKLAIARAHLDVVEMGRRLLAAEADRVGAARELSRALSEYATAVDATRDGQKKALAARMESITLQEGLLVADPSDVVGARRLANLKAYIAERSIAGIGHYPEDDVDFFSGLVTAQPENITLRIPYRIALKNKAIMAVERRDAQKFRTISAQYIAELRRAADSDPSNIESRRRLASGLNKMADYEWRFSRGQSGLSLKQEALKLNREVWRADTADALSLENLDESLSWFRDIAKHEGDIAAMDAISLERIAITEAYQQRYPNSAYARERLFWAIFARAETELELGRTTAAMMNYEAALTLANRQYRLQLGTEQGPKYCCGGGIFMSLRVLDRVKGIEGAALSQGSAEVNLAIMRTFAAGSANLADQVSLMTSLNVAGDAAALAKRNTQALARYREVLTIAATDYIPAMKWRYEYVKQAHSEALMRIARVTGKASDRAAAKAAADAYTAEFPIPPRSKRPSTERSFYDPPIFLDKEPPQ